MKVFLFALIALLSGPVIARDWVFANLTDPKEGQIIISNDGGGARTKVLVRLCGETEEFHCIDSDVLKFAVPKVLKGRASWEYSGTTYRIYKRDTLSLLGRPMSLIYIDNVASGEKQMRYLYSTTQGLIGFLVRDNKVRPTYILENGCGIGASKECKEEDCAMAGPDRIVCKPKS